jgi:hypothetical protein
MQVFGHIAAKPDFLPAHGQNLGWHRGYPKISFGRHGANLAHSRGIHGSGCAPSKISGCGRPMAVSDERQLIRD